jgi:hypothetical protein
VYTNVCNVFFNHLLLERVGDDSGSCNGLLQRLKLPTFGFLSLLWHPAFLVTSFFGLSWYLPLQRSKRIILNCCRVEDEDEDCDTNQILLPITQNVTYENDWFVKWLVQMIFVAFGVALARRHGVLRWSMLDRCSAYALGFHRLCASVSGEWKQQRER